MITISLCMIIKDEEEVLERCLTSIKDVVDEIIVVDTGSSDHSVEIAKRFSDKVFSFTWNDNFSDARNYAFSFATMDYCMWMDADDIMQDNDQRALLELKRTLPPQCDVVMMKYHTAFDAQGNLTFSYYRERLLKNDHSFLWEGAVHEVITPHGIIEYVDIAITHKKMKVANSKRNLMIFQNLVNQGKILNPREQFYYARELYYHQRYEDAIVLFSTFLKEQQGWIENNLEACKFLAYCYYELKQDEDAVSALLSSLRYDVPRAEICCDIGKHFFDRTAYKQAIFWYKQASLCERKEEDGGFVMGDCYDFIPYLQLCVCYDRLQDHTTACAYNEKAGLIKPENETFLKNREYFSKLQG